MKTNVRPKKFAYSRSLRKSGCGVGWLSLPIVLKLCCGVHFISQPCALRLVFVTLVEMTCSLIFAASGKRELRGGSCFSLVTSRFPVPAPSGSAVTVLFARSALRPRPLPFLRSQVGS